MKALSSKVIITNVSTRVDGSVGIRLSTPELQPEEKTAIFELQGIELRMLLHPSDQTEVELKEVKADLSEKTPSQRLRSVLFIAWKQNNEAIDFEVFYRQKMNGIIERIKLSLEQVA